MWLIVNWAHMNNNQWYLYQNTNIMQSVQESPCWIRTIQAADRYAKINHWGWVTHIFATEQGRHWFRWWLVAQSASSHYLNQCWLYLFRWWLFALSVPSYYLIQCWITIGCDHRNLFQWHLRQNTITFIDGNAFENVDRKMTAILFRPQCVNIFIVHLRVS